jgi:voltage-gated potassium channel Kch
MFGLIVVFRNFGTALRHGWRDPAFRGVVWLALTIILAGGFGFARLEGWTFFQGVYFSVITLTTVGYGDLTPVTFAGRLFAILYVLLGVGIIVALVGQVAAHIIAARTGRPDQSSEPS